MHSQQLPFAVYCSAMWPYLQGMPVKYRLRFLSLAICLVVFVFCFIK